MTDKKQPFGEKVKRFTRRFDQYINNFTGLGSQDRDKLQSSFFYRSNKLNDDVLENLYHDNDIAARVCDAIPDQLLRQGFTINIGDEAYNDDLEDASNQNPENAKQYADVIRQLLMAVDDLGMKEKFTDAGVWGNVFGGSAIYIGVDDGNAQDEPLNLETIQEVKFLKVLDKRDIYPSDFYLDPLDPKFGQPKIYKIFPSNNTLAPVTVQNLQAFVHESRIIPFHGTRTSARRRRENRGWSDSILQKIDEVLRQFSVSWQSTANLMQDAAQGVFKMNGVIEALSANSPEYISLRLQDMDMNRSNTRAIVVDSDSGEDFRRDAYSFNGIPQILELFMSRLSAAVDIPVTRLFGISPAGMNATGESDMRMFYDRIKANQKFNLKPKLEYVLKLLMLSKKGPTKGVEFPVWSVCFPSPWQSTDLEKAQIRKLNSETNKAQAEADATNQAIAAGTIDAGAQLSIKG